MSVVPLPQPERPPIPFQWASTIAYDPEELREIVESVLTAGGMSMWYGESNSGKTTILLDLGFRMPSGLPWLGKRTAKGAVIYIAAEGAGSVKRRLEAYRQHHACKVYAFGLISTTLNLMDPSADVEDLIQLIDDLKTELLSTEPLQLIIIDTVARVMGGSNENASEDMARLISAGDRIRKHTGAHVAWVHHSGKDATKGARGHSSLRAAVDTECEITSEGGVHAVTVTKQRDLSTKGEKLSARFTSINLGTNQWGNPVTACVVEPVEAASAHLQAMVDASAREAAEAVVLSGFRKLLEMGIATTSAKNSPDYLPRQLLDMRLAGTFDRTALTGAMNDLMVRGILKREVIGHYSNRDPRYGLVLNDA
ncbi:helicase RepA family protein [Piscinibacter sp.]|uniref:helicase RepA family protein n=1 Tax=Piscinibacter sp. TaxID=1903157 RepID=UPI002C13BABA|nr:helicase RepA family protein [Albitalea sp.]HUG26220.1 helicase RepA family protein [Albitalea sp.]